MVKDVLEEMSEIIKILIIIYVVVSEFDQTFLELDG